VATNIKGLFILNEATRINIPKIREDKTRSEARIKPDHQKKDFIKT